MFKPMVMMAEYWGPKLGLNEQDAEVKMRTGAKKTRREGKGAEGEVKILQKICGSAGNVIFQVKFACGNVKAWYVIRGEEVFEIADPEWSWTVVRLFNG